jgi:hypothetical protein
VKGVTIPVAVTVFPGEQCQAPRSWTERAYPNLIYFNEVDKGGHFAAWEQPNSSQARCGPGSAPCGSTRGNDARERAISQRDA